MPRPLNVLYLHSHDTGRWVQPYGFPVATPAIQKLAEEGILFRNAFCAGPTCSPSRAALLTGQNPHSAGMIGLAHRGFHLTDGSHHLPHFLRATAGYTTAMSGIQHTMRPGEEALAGYDLTRPEWRGEAITSEAETFILDANARTKPWFLSVGYFETHRLGNGSFNEPQAGDSRYAPSIPPLNDGPELRTDLADFAVAVNRLDTFYGRVLAALERSGQAENTLVICTTDHGPAFPRMKCNLTDAGTGVLLILRGPGGFSGGQLRDAMVSHLDLFPTVCELAGLEPPAWLEGSSLVPLTAGDSVLREALFSEVSYHAAYEPMRSIRTSKWKYIRRFDRRTTPVLPNCDDGPARRALLAEGWGERDENVSEQLYDLIFDPAESNNLAHDYQFAVVRDDLRAQLAQWMERTHDPLLIGPVPAPAGSQVNDPAGRDANGPILTIVPAGFANSGAGTQIL